VDYKTSFLSLVEYKDFDQIGFIKLGNIHFMKISFTKQKPFDLIIPLIKGDGRIFKVTFDKKDNLAEVASKFYYFNLAKTNWLPEMILADSESMTLLDLFDLFSSEDFKTKLKSSTAAQALYAFCFEASGAILKKGDVKEIELWKSKLENIPKLIETIPTQDLQEGETDPKLKLLQNFRDIIDALENKNSEYFGISSTTTI
jgi:hypothetical protein